MQKIYIGLEFLDTNHENASISYCNFFSIFFVVKSLESNAVFRVKSRAIFFNVIFV